MYRSPVLRKLRLGNPLGSRKSIQASEFCYFSSLRRNRLQNSAGRAEEEKAAGLRNGRNTFGVMSIPNVEEFAP